LETRDEEERLVKKKERTKKEKFTCLGPWKLEMRRKIGKKKERTKKDKLTCLGPWKLDERESGSKRNGRGHIPALHI
jgi:hypothetical protein